MNVLNGDPAAGVRLTELGREQSRALGEAVGPVELVVHTEFARTRETAEFAWPGTPTLVLPELNEIAFGRWEGTRWDQGYGAWVRSAGPADECPGGGESRVTATRRYVRGFRQLLARPEERVALVTHGAQVRLLLLAAARHGPTPVLEHVPPAQWGELACEELASAIELLEAWVASPSFQAD